MTDTPGGSPPVLGERYALQVLIGQGGMAQVYRAYDRVLGRHVAVKVLRAASGAEADRARFADEARTLARLSHPGLVTILDAATAGDQPYLVMELVNGPSLADCCRGVALEPERVAALGAQLADALAHAHEAGIVHRDLKPANVLLAEDDRALLTDFGIARLMSESAGHTATGVTIGTAAYLAPEQVRGEEISAGTDVYSLGLVLLEALTGERAYQGSPTEAALARLTTPPGVPRDLPPQWQDLLRDMTASRPADRPSTMQVAHTLRRLAAGLDAAAATAALRADSGHTRPLTRPMATGGEEPAAEGTLHLRAPTGHGSPGQASTQQASTGRVSSLRRRYGLPWGWVGAGLALALVVLVLLVLGTGPDSGTGNDVPADVPARLQGPLQDLHDAVEGDR